MSRTAAQALQRTGNAISRIENLPGVAIGRIARASNRITRGWTDSVAEAVGRRVVRPNTPNPTRNTVDDLFPDTTKPWNADGTWPNYGAENARRTTSTTTTRINGQDVDISENTTWNSSWFDQLDENGLPIYNSVPPKPGANNPPTFGIASLGDDQIRVMSRGGNPGSTIKGAGDTPEHGFGSWTHAEGNTVGIMRETGIQRAEITINNPNGMCRTCRNQIPALLTEVGPDARLTVRWIDQDGIRRQATCTAGRTCVGG